MKVEYTPETKLDKAHLKGAAHVEKVAIQMLKDGEHPAMVMQFVYDTWMFKYRDLKESDLEND